jgi:hypothetical protein
MSTDVEELLHEGMERFGQDMQMPSGIAARARRRLHWRRLQMATGAVAAVAAAALVTVTAAPGGHPAPVTLAAWAVITEPNGTVAVSIHDLRDPAGLQRALQAHGVPATVRFYPAGSLMPGCVTSVPSRLATIERQVFVQPPAGRRGQALLYINPAAVPATDKIAIDAVAGNGFSIGLLTHNGQCPQGSKPGANAIGHS